MTNKAKKALKQAFSVLAKCHWPEPGTAEGQILYEFKYDLNAKLVGISAYLDDELLGEFLDLMISPDVD